LEVASTPDYAMSVSHRHSPHKKRLALVEHDDVAGRTVVTHPMCWHCQGEGVVSAEVQR